MHPKDSFHRTNYNLYKKSMWAELPFICVGLKVMNWKAKIFRKRDQINTTTINPTQNESINKKCLSSFLTQTHTYINWSKRFLSIFHWMTPVTRLFSIWFSFNLFCVATFFFWIFYRLCSLDEVHFMFEGIFKLKI